MANPKTFQLNSVEISLHPPKKLLNPAQEVEERIAHTESSYKGLLTWFLWK